jgi:hypothetical protein
MKLLLFQLFFFLSISFPQTTSDIILPVSGSFNFTLDENKNLHISWGNLTSAIWYSVFNSSGDLIKQFKFPEIEGCCVESNLELKHTNVVVAWRYISQTFNSYIRGQVFSTNQDSANDNNINFYDPYGDAERSKPGISFINDSTFIIYWSGNGPQTPIQRGIYGEISTVSLSTLGDKDWSK